MTITDGADQIASLKDWVIAAASTLNLPLPDDLYLKPVDGDAGFRKYFRLNSLPPLIAVYSPPDTENNPQFCAVAHALREHGVHTPQVLARDFKHGFMLLEDLGFDLLLGELNDDSVEGLYAHAMMTLLHIQQSECDYSIYPQYNKERLLSELHVFPNWFIKQLLSRDLNQDEEALLDRCFDMLCHRALNQTQVVVHRDFHSRNLLVIEGASLGVIDFQDAVIGPVTYDLASLLRDCYISWSDAQVENWCLTYLRMAQEVGVMPVTDKQAFMCDFDLMGLQRHIKVLGVFSRLFLRDSKSRYLNDLPLVIFYVRKIIKKYSELSEFNEWFESEIMPLIKKQSWWRE